MVTGKIVRIGPLLDRQVGLDDRRFTDFRGGGASKRASLELSGIARCISQSDFVRNFVYTPIQRIAHPQARGCGIQDKALPRPAFQHLLHSLCAIMGSLREGVLRRVYNPIIPNSPYGSLTFPKAP